MREASPLQPGDPDRIGTYEVTGRLGEGGQGVVYVGWDTTGEMVAIKLLRAQFSGDGRARERFLREIEAAQRVAPFCTARVIDASAEGESLYIVSEYVQGPSLHELVSREGPLLGAALDRLAISTTTALAAIHEAGIVHRDFKPGNVLIASDGPRVIDFGIARLLDATSSLTSRVVGTPAFMSPEQLAGDPVGPPSDIFAWGSTMVYAATGVAPFGTDSIPAIMNRIVHGEPDIGDLRGPLREVVGATLSKQPETRPTSRQVLDHMLGSSAFRHGPAHPVAGHGAPAHSNDGSGGEVRPAVLPVSSGSADTGPNADAQPVGDAPPSWDVSTVPPGVRVSRARWLGAAAAAAGLSVLGAGVLYVLIDREPDGKPANQRTAPGNSQQRTPASVASGPFKGRDFRIGAVADVPPFSFQKEDGSGITGASPEVARTILGRLGARKIDFKESRPDQLISGLSSKDFELTAGFMLITSERCDQISFSEPLYAVRTAFVVRRGNPKRITKLRDFLKNPGAKLGVARGTPYGSFASAAGIGKERIREFPTVARAMPGVRSGEIDAVIAPAPQLRWFERTEEARQGGRDDLEVTPSSLEAERHVTTFYIAFGFHRKNKSLRDVFNTEIKEMRKNNELLPVLKPYGFTASDIALTLQSSTARQCR